MKPSSFAVFALCLLFVFPAPAQKRKTNSKDILATDDTKATNVVKPKKEDDARKLLNDEDLGKVAKYEEELSKVRKNTIKDLRDILRKKPLYKNKADALFRIAENEWDEAKYRYFLARKEYDKQRDAYFKGTLKAEPPEPVADYSLSIKEYKKLLKEFPNYNRIDVVMFYLGRGLITAGKDKEGASYMLRLTKEYPTSQFKTKAYLAVAEYYFDNDLLFAAKSNYLKVLEDKTSAEYPYALYKVGYVYYNMKDYEDSIRSFKEVVGLSKANDSRKIDFKNEAYSAVTLSFAEVNDGWRRARDYFKAEGGDTLAIDKLETMARIFEKQDKVKLELEVYEYLISSNKDGQKVPEYAEKITANYKNQNLVVKTEETINRFVEYFDPKRKWYSINGQYEEPRIRANQYREEQIDYLISKFHIKAQEDEKKKKPKDAVDELYRKAAQYYEKYIALFPKSKDLYEKEYFLAEIYYFQPTKLFEQDGKKEYVQDWDQAAKHYKRVVEIDPKGKYSTESAYAIILARQEKLVGAGLVQDTGRKTGRKGKKRSRIQKASVTYVKRDDNEFKARKKTELHPLQREFLGACGFYVETYPKDKRVPEVSFLAAETWIKNGHYSEGVKQLEAIMEYHPKHRFAGHAAATLFDANYRLRRWDQMERWGRYMLKRRNFKVLKKRELRSVIAISINNYAQELVKEGKPDKAAKEMLRFVNEFPKHELAAIALYNAAAITEKAERTKQAIELYERVIRSYRKTKQATEAHWVLGLLYESQTDFETAASYFEKMAKFPDVPQVKDALYNAGYIRSALQQNDKAIEIFETFIKKFPKTDDSPKLMLEIARMHHEGKDFKKVKKTYDRYIKKYGKTNKTMVPEIYLRKAKLIQEEGGKPKRVRKKATAELSKAQKAYGRLSDEQKKEGIARRAMAEVRFLLAEYQYDDFESLELSFPVRKLMRTLLEKAKLLTKAEKSFFKVTELKAWSVSAGALYRVGESYYLYGKSLDELPTPEELTPDEEDEYRAQLDEQAVPLTEKAIKSTQNALKLAHENRVYNEWSQKAAALLAKLSPELFPVLQDATVNTEHPVPATFSTSFIDDPGYTLNQIIPPKPKPEPPAPGKPGVPGESPAAADEGASAVAPSAASEQGGEAAAGDAKSAANEASGEKETGGQQ